MSPVYRWLPVFALLALLPGSLALAQSAEPPSVSTLRGRLANLAPYQQDEVIWLARCIYSESDRTHEQKLVAWVVRNRVETKYRGTTYREVVLEPSQFSAFNEPSIRRNHILSLNQYSLSKAWRGALAIALNVYRAPANQRPFDITTRHFYSPVSMKGGRTPMWAKNETPLSSPRLGVDPYRFKFYAGLDEGLDMPVHMASHNEPTTQTAEPTVQPALSRSRLRSRRFSGRVKRPVRPHLSRRGTK